MKETGIIMSGNHPKLILDGIKTMTRRVMEPELNKYIVSFQEFLSVKETKDHWSPPEGYYALMKCNAHRDFATRYVRSPYGQVRDRLWVRETWATYRTNDDWTIPMIGRQSIIFYKADDDNYGYIGKNRSAMFMPQWASRITLEITELWAEMLRSISPTDAMAEGGYTVEEFIKLYLKINHLPDDANPWNWAIKYKLLDTGNWL